MLGRCGGQAVEAPAFADMCKSSFPSEAVAVQRYVREKGHVDKEAPKLAMYFHEYT